MIDFRLSEPPKAADSTVIRPSFKTTSDKFSQLENAKEFICLMLLGRTTLVSQFRGIKVNLSCNMVVSQPEVAGS
jgi:hypothetical protein